MNTDLDNTYNLNFRACSLRPELARIVAECYLQEEDWALVTERILATNALQTRSESTLVRLEREMRQRLSTLTHRQIEILAHAPTEDRAAMTWLATCKRFAFVRDFTVEVLREKIEVQNTALLPSDYENFIAVKTLEHPQLASMKEVTADKVRQVTLRMLKEVGILTEKNGISTLSRPVLSFDARQAILDDDKRWLAVFLVPHSELST